MKPPATGNKDLHQFLKHFSTNSAFMNARPHFSAPSSFIFSFTSSHLQLFPYSISITVLNCSVSCFKLCHQAKIPPRFSGATIPQITFHWAQYVAQYSPSFGHVNSRSALRIRNQAPTIQLHTNFRINTWNSMDKLLVNQKQDNPHAKLIWLRGNNASFNGIKKSRYSHPSQNVSSLCISTHFFVICDKDKNQTKKQGVFLQR